PGSQRDGAGAVFGAELVEDRGGVELDRALADVERAGDLLARQAPRDQPQDLALPLRQVVWGARRPNRRDELRRDAGLQRRAAARDLADRPGDVRDRGTLQEVALRAGPDRAEDALVAVVGGEDQHPRGRAERAESRDRLDAADARQLEVEQDDV